MEIRRGLLYKCAVALGVAGLMLKAGNCSASLNFSHEWRVFTYVHPTQLQLGGLKTFPKKLPSADGGLTEGAQQMADPLEGKTAWQLNFGAIAESFKLKAAAVAFQTVTAEGETDYWIGCSADWWMECYVNGELAYSTLDRGNQSTQYHISDHLFPIHLKKGKNAIAFKVLSGSKGWRLVYAFLSSSEAEVLGRGRLKTWTIELKPALIPVQRTTDSFPLSDQGNAKAWSLVESMTDEFDGPLDENKWDRTVRSWSPHWSWITEQARTETGRLRLEMKYDPHNREDLNVSYKSGIVKSKAKPILYGYFEARIKGSPINPGTCTAFWVYKSSGRMHTEIDFLETGQGWQGNLANRIDQNVHIFKHPDLPRLTGEEKNHWVNMSYFLAPWNPSDEFHVYGCEWNDQRITWYVDGVRTHELENKYWFQPLDLILSFGLRPPYNLEPSPSGFPAVMLVDYVRVWQARTDF